MSSDNSLESFGWIPHVIDHSKFNITVSDNVRVCFIFLLSFGCALFTFKARLIKVDLFTHDNGLDGEENLQESRNFGVPIFRGTSSPSSQQT